MTTLEKKSDIIVLIQLPAFQELLGINSAEEFESKGYAWPNRPDEYFDHPDAEVAVGVHLFSTPTRGNNCGSQYGTWLDVCRLYGNPELAFRVIGTDYVPWGNDHDPKIGMGDYRTLAEALDIAFLAHEQGSFEVDLESMTPAQGLADEEAGVKAALSQHEALARRRQVEQAAQRERMAAPIPLEVLPALLSKAQAQGFVFNTMDNVHLAVAINNHLFAGKGELFGCFNQELNDGLPGRVGITVVGVLDGATGQYAYYDLDGIPKTVEQVQAVTLAKFKADCRLPPDAENLLETTDGWGDDITVDLAANTLQKLSAEEIAELYDVEIIDGYSWCPANRVLFMVVDDYRYAREVAYQQSQRTAELSL
jgi:hypothetical protein